MSLPVRCHRFVLAGPANRLSLPGRASWLLLQRSGLHLHAAGSNCWDLGPLDAGDGPQGGCRRHRDRAGCQGVRRQRLHGHSDHAGPFVGSGTRRPGLHDLLRPRRQLHDEPRSGRTHHREHHVPVEHGRQPQLVARQPGRLGLLLARATVRECDPERLWAGPRVEPCHRGHCVLPEAVPPGSPGSRARPQTRPRSPSGGRLLRHERRHRLGRSGVQPDCQELPHPGG